MQNFLKEEYIHIGAKKIYRELWHDIEMDQVYTITKPYGGLWCSRKNKDNICDWLDYLKYEKPEHYDSSTYLDVSLIKLKENIKLLKIETTNDVLNLIQSGLIKDYSKNKILVDNYFYKHELLWLPDYENISKYYDAMFVNPYASDCFNKFSIDTMLVMNPNAILYYIPTKSDFANNKIIESENKLYITTPNSDYYKYLEYIYNLFDIVNEKDHKTYINKLLLLKKEIISNKNNYSRNLGYNINREIDDKSLLKVVANNMYIKKYKKILHK